MSSGPPIAVLADLHANLPALQAVIADLDAHGVETVWCLGDVLGYGPFAAALLREIAADPRTWHAIRGNHDDGLLAALPDPEGWQPPRIRAAAVRAIRQQARELAHGHAGLRWLAELPAWRRPRPDALLIHPNDSSHGLYAGADAEDAPFTVSGEHRRLRARYAADADRLLIFRGHTHRPCCVVTDEAGRWRASPVEAEAEIALEGRDAWINPGSVGESRIPDDPRAFYCLYWPPPVDRLRFRRIEYPVVSVRRALEGRYDVLPAWNIVPAAAKNHHPSRP